MQDTPPRLQLQFLGATSTVTGSRYLLEAGAARILVDCGLFQGYKTLRLRNWSAFTVAPGSIDAVVLTHAHLDHSGHLPRLVREGFRGRIWCTHATASLCRILLPDSARLLEEEAAHANRSGWSKHHPAQPLYTEEDAHRALAMMQEVGFGEEFAPAEGVRASLRAQGHILGAAAALLEHRGRRIVFSGDIGRPDDPVMPAPEPLPAVDWVVTESTYGDRSHPASSLEDELVPVLRRVAARGGVALLPSFAVGRAQLLLHVIARLQAQGRVPEVPLYLNSPMATDVTGLYGRYAGLHRLGEEDLRRMRERVRVVNTVEESKALNRRTGPMVVVSASGMLTGGRVLHHLVAFAPDPRNAVVLVGYQAGGTRGAALARGERHVRVFGQEVAVAAEVVQLEASSGHADAGEILAWLRTAPQPPRRVFVTHGEPDAADALRRRIAHELGWDAHVPEHLERIELA